MSGDAPGGDVSPVERERGNMMMCLLLNWKYKIIPKMQIFPGQWTSWLPGYKPSEQVAFCCQVYFLKNLLKKETNVGQ